MTLRDKAIEVANELTGRGDAWVNARKYAPHLVAMGEELRSAAELDGGTELRPDVITFALKMAEMMDLKDREKGPVEDYPLSKALMNLQYQWRKLEENPVPRGAEMQRILVHIANFAMIGWHSIEGEKQ